MSPSKPPGLAARLLLLMFSALFALAFGGVGIGFGVWPLSRMLHAAWAVQSWQPVPAQVLSAELDVLHDDDGSTHRLRARYRYSFNGRSFESERVGLDDRRMADNLGDWHAVWHQRLDAARNSGQNVTAWVDPVQPAQALLDRAIRWPWLVFHLPFAFVFTGVGLVAGWFFLRVLRGQHAPASKVDPGRSSASRAQRPLWFMAMFWCGIAFPLAVIFWMGDSPWWVNAFVSVFPVIGLGLLGAAIRQSVQAWRFSGTQPQWRPSPPRAGEVLAVSLDMSPRAMRDLAAVPAGRRLRLAQYRVDDAGSGETERQVELVDAVVTALPDPQGGERWQARFHLPADAPTHGGRRSGERVDWRLEVLDAKGRPGVFFDVPVQAAAHGPAVSGGVVDRFDRRARWNREEAIGPAPTTAAEATPLPASVRVVETPDAVELRFAASGWRWLAALTMAAAMLLIWWGWGALLRDAGWAALGAWRWWLLALLVWLGLHAASRRRLLTVRDDGIVVWVTSLMGQSAHHLAPSAFDHLFHKIRFTQSTANGADREFHALHARERAGGPELRLTPALSGAESAVSVARAVLAARRDRADRFTPGAQRREVPAGWRPGPGWLLWTLLMAGLLAGAMALSREPVAVVADATGAEQRWRSGLRAVDARLVDAQDAGDAMALAAALGAGAHPDLLNARGSSMLMLAAYRGQLDHVDLLLRHGATPDLRQTQRDSERGDTALLRALYGGHLVVAQRLVDGGASLRVKNRWDWGPVHMAAQSGCVPCLEWLAASGLPLHEPATASRGETPVMLAAARGQVQALAWFEAKGVDLWQRDPHGQDALAWARFRQQNDAQAWLLARAPKGR